MLAILALLGLQLILPSVVILYAYDCSIPPFYPFQRFFTPFKEKSPLWGMIYLTHFLFRQIKIYSLLTKQLFLHLDTLLPDTTILHPNSFSKTYIKAYKEWNTFCPIHYYTYPNSTSSIKADLNWITALPAYDLRARLLNPFPECVQHRLLFF